MKTIYSDISGLLLLLAPATAAATAGTADRVNARQLLANATPVRKLQNDFELTSRHSIIFKTCQTLSVEAPDAADSEYLQEALANGQVSAVQSFVEFDVCLTDYCYSGNAGDRTTFVTSLSSFMNALSQFLPMKIEQYCEGCAENQDYCSQNNDRRLSQQERQVQEQAVYEQINCGRCYAYGCMNQNGYYDYSDEQWSQQMSLEWIQAMTSCHQDNQEEGQALSYGFMCNESGSGVEIAVFLDDECTLYDSQLAYGMFMSSLDHYYWKQTKPNVEFIFNAGFTCADPEIKYVNPQLEGYEDYDFSASYANDDGAGGQVAEWCSMVMEAEDTPVSMDYCGADGNNNNNNANNNNGNNYALKGNYNEDLAYYYTLSEQDAQDMTIACSILKGASGGEYIYSKQGSGAMYSYNQIDYSMDHEDWQSELDDLTSKTAKNAAMRFRQGAVIAGWAIALIVLACLIFVAIVIFVYTCLRRERYWAWLLSPKKKRTPDEESTIGTYDAPDSFYMRIEKDEKKNAKK